MAKNSAMTQAQPRADTGGVTDFIIAVPTARKNTTLVPAVRSTLPPLVTISQILFLLTQKCACQGKSCKILVVY